MELKFNIHVIFSTEEEKSVIESLTNNEFIEKSIERGKTYNNMEEFQSDFNKGTLCGTGTYLRFIYI